MGRAVFRERDNNLEASEAQRDPATPFRCNKLILNSEFGTMLAFRWDRARASFTASIFELPKSKLPGIEHDTNF